MEVVSLHVPEQKVVALCPIDVKVGDCSRAGKGTVENEPIADHQTEAKRDYR
ncbi:unannotated protein [freshwater metagenome]|uniref:Unannotated protein n=1 Tax=freshwater metagenome TaxID=449393 RepID=A0A6J6AQB7_9ZZZZ